MPLRKNLLRKSASNCSYVTEIEKQARTVEIEAEFDNLDSDIMLLVGYSADVEVITQRHEAVLRIPTRSHSSRQPGAGSRRK